jgi:dephospho-CoA kinase
MAKIIIGLVGPIASGKGVTKKYLETKHGAKHCKFSTPLRDILIRLRLDISRDHLIDMSTILREKFGQDLFAKVIASDASRLDADIVVVDGVRRIDDIEHLSTLPYFKLVKIDADPKIRYERLKIRNENVGDAEKTFSEFMEDHERETEATIPGVMEKAQYSLDNDGSLEELYKQIDELAEKVLK